MAWVEAFFYWQMWATAAFLAGIAYVLLAIFVPLDATAKQAAMVGAFLAKETNDMKFALVGAQMAAQSRKKRKRTLSGVAGAAGLLLSALVFIMIPSAATLPFWLFLVAGVAGPAIGFFSKR